MSEQRSVEELPSHTFIPGVLELLPPATDPAPLVLDSPHSGEQYPEDFRHCMSRAGLRALEDAFVDQLFSHVPVFGASLLKALFPRSYIDPNRAHDDIDPRMLAEQWPRASNPGPKSASGIGLIFRHAASGPVYDRKLSVAEVQQRLDRYYWPYHSTLSRTLDLKWRYFGEVFHVNCHSMKSVSIGAGEHGKGSPRPDFVVGDLDGSSCDRRFTETVRSYLADHGYHVTVNDPYKGVELVRRYSNPREGRHSLQIEIKRSLYMDERRIEISDGFQRLEQLLRGLTGELARFVMDRR